jgi:hypothetical protein
MKAVFVAMVLAVPASAQEWIDHDLLMQQNAERVVVETDAAGRQTRRLDMGNGVLVSCDPDGCMGMDQSEYGAVGCTFSIYTEVAAFAKACNVPLSADETAALDGAFDEIGSFVAENAVPSLPASYPQEFLARRVMALGEEIAAASEDICANPFEGDIGFFLTAIIQDEQREDLRRSLAIPRLPVMNPCL